MNMNGVRLKYINWDTRVNYQYSQCLNIDIRVCVPYSPQAGIADQINGATEWLPGMKEKSRLLSPECNDCDIWRNNHPAQKTGLWVPVYLFSKVSLHSTFIFPLGSRCWGVRKNFTKWLKFFSRMPGHILTRQEQYMITAMPYGELSHHMKDMQLQ